MYKQYHIYLKEARVKRNVLLIIAIVFVFTAIFLLPKDFLAQAPAGCPPDKELCARMLRFGQQAYVRGKYLDAKEYFRKALQADPASMNAWTFYDMTVVFALAEKVEKNSNLVLPDVSTRQEAAADLSSAPPPAPSQATSAKKPAKAPAKIPTKTPAEAPAKTPAEAPAKTSPDGFKFKIVDDEGC